MSRVSTSTKGPIEDYLALVDAVAAPAVHRLSEVRAQARARFAELGFPHGKLEAWRETSLAPALARTYSHAAAVSLDRAREALEALPQANLGLPRLVVVNGRFEPALSDIDALALPIGSFAGSLAEAASARLGVLEVAFGKFAPWNEHGVLALATALASDAAVIALGPRTDFSKSLPIHVVQLSIADGVETVVAPRLVIAADRESRVHVVETFVGYGDRAHFALPVTEISVGDGAHVTHTRVQAAPREAFHVGYVSAHCGRDAHFVSQSLALGGALARVELDVRFLASGAHADLLGLYMPRGSQHLDNRTRIDHAVPLCTSHQIYKGILAERSKAVFNGTIVVHQDAQKTDARQQNDNLLLSNDALVQTRPQLEIYADDVKCAHGATIGRLDPEAFFYLQSRGVPPGEARAMLTRAFAHEVLDKLDVPRLSALVDEEIDTLFTQ